MRGLKVRGAHRASVGVVASHPQLDLAASGADDGSLTLFRRSNGLSVAKLGHSFEAEVQALSWAADDVLLVGAGTRLWLVRIPSDLPGQQQQQQPGGEGGEDLPLSPAEGPASPPAAAVLSLGEPTLLGEFSDEIGAISCSQLGEKMGVVAVVDDSGKLSVGSLQNLGTPQFREPKKPLAWSVGDSLHENLGSAVVLLPGSCGSSSPSSPSPAPRSGRGAPSRCWAVSGGMDCLLRSHTLRPAGGGLSAQGLGSVSVSEQASRSSSSSQQQMVNPAFVHALDVCQWWPSAKTCDSCGVPFSGDEAPGLSLIAAGLGSGEVRIFSFHGAEAAPCFEPLPPLRIHEPSERGPGGRKKTKKQLEVERLRSELAIAERAAELKKRERALSRLTLRAVLVDSLGALAGVRWALVHAGASAPAAVAGSAADEPVAEGAGPARARCSREPLGPLELRLVTASNDGRVCLWNASSLLRDCPGLVPPLPTTGETAVRDVCGSCSISAAVATEDSSPQEGQDGENLQKPPSPPADAVASGAAVEQKKSKKKKKKKQVSPESPVEAVAPLTSANEEEIEPLVVDLSVEDFERSKLQRQTPILPLPTPTDFCERYVIRRFKHPKKINGISVSPDGLQLLIADVSPFVMMYRPGVIV